MSHHNHRISHNQINLNQFDTHSASIRQLDQPRYDSLVEFGLDYR